MQIQRFLVLLALTLLPAFSLTPAASSQGSPEAVASLVEEGTERTQVWATLEELCLGIGPRLTGSAGLERASTWARGKFASYGMKNAHLWKWGEVPVRFDRGPSSVRMVSPVEADFEFTTRAWAPGTDGPLRGFVFKRPTTPEEFEAVRNRLDGAWILEDVSSRRRRGSSKDEDAEEGESEDQKMSRLEKSRLRKEIKEAIEEADIAGTIRASRNDQVTTGGVRDWMELTMDTLSKDRSITIRKTDYDALDEQLSAGKPVELEADLVHFFTEGPFPVFDVIAEIPGTEFPDEVVIISAHLDSWNGPGSQGCQDNGTGSSVMIEAARILAASGVQPRRTIRVCLWSGEEQGLFGSKRYAEWLKETGQLDGISACFVDDGGTGYQGGLNCTAEMAPILEEAIAPVNAHFTELPISVSVQKKMPRGGSSDHASFNRLGVPGFYWTEKGLTGREARNYRFVWHTQNDTTRYAVEENLVQSAVCSAVTAYNLAMADSILPRYVEEPEPEEAAAVEASSSPEASGPLEGKWDMAMYSEGEVVFEFTLTFQHHEDDSISGDLGVMGSGGPLLNMTYDKETKTVKGMYKSESYGTSHYEGTLQEDGTLKGQRKSDTGEREIRGKRAKEEAKPEEAQQGGEKPPGKIG